MTAVSAATSPRRDHPEILDDPAVDAGLVRRSMRDVALANRLFGGRRAVLRELDLILPRLGQQVVLIDVGTGLGDIPQAAADRARVAGHELFAIGVDSSFVLARESRPRLGAAVVADAGSLPFRNSSAELVTCSQLLHHFASDGAASIISEMSRVSSGQVVVGDIRRSRIATVGLWLASFLLRFHPVSRHDGIASIRRGFTASELRRLVVRAVGIAPEVRRRAGFRVVARWSVR